MRTGTALQAALGAACALAASAAGAQGYLGCPAGYHQEERDVRGAKMEYCVGETRACSEGYAGQVMQNKSFSCVKFQAVGTICPVGGGMQYQGKLYCWDPAMKPTPIQSTPMYPEFAEKVGPNSYRFVSSLICPKDYHYGLLTERQAICVGPKAFSSCGEGYSLFSAGAGSLGRCAARVPWTASVCPGFGLGVSQDKEGYWWCSEPVSDHCPKDGRYEFGKPSGEQDFRCMFDPAGSSGQKPEPLPRRMVWEGKVLRSTGKVISIALKQGGTTSFGSDSKTKITRDGAAVPFSAIKAGDYVVLNVSRYANCIEAVSTSGALTSSTSSCGTAPQMPTKAWKGKVTSNNGNLISIGGNTRFHPDSRTKITRDGAVVPLSDIEVGDDVVVKTSNLVDSVEATSTSSSEK